MIVIFFALFVNVHAQNYSLAPPRALPKPLGGFPVIVSSSFQLLKISQVDTTASIVTLQAYYDEFWFDLNLAYTGQNSTAPLDPLGCQMIPFGDRCDPARGKRFYLAQYVPWAPDNTFTTANQRTDQEPLGDVDTYYTSSFLRVYEDGYVHRSIQVQLYIPVEYKIQFYPFEVIPVTITIESYGNTGDILEYVLDNDTFIGGDSSLALPGYFVAENLSQVDIITQSYIEGSYYGVNITFVLYASAATRAGIAILTTSILVMLGAIPIWYRYCEMFLVACFDFRCSTTFVNSMTIVTTAELAAFALEFSFARPTTRETLYIEGYFLVSQLFIASVGAVIFCQYILNSIRKAALPPGSIVTTQMNSSIETAEKFMPDADDVAKKQIAALLMIESAVRGEKSSDFEYAMRFCVFKLNFTTSAIKPWQLGTITFYSLLWIVTVLAFLSAGVHLQLGALSQTDPRFLDTTGLQSESETLFVIVYVVGGVLSALISVCIAFLWKLKRQRAIAVLAKAVIKVRGPSAVIELEQRSRSNSLADIMTPVGPASLSASSASIPDATVKKGASNVLRGVVYGRCSECDCVEYERPTKGTRCDMCDHAPLRHEHAKPAGSSSSNGGNAAGDGSSSGNARRRNRNKSREGAENM